MELETGVSESALAADLVRRLGIPEARSRALIDELKSLKGGLETAEAVAIGRGSELADGIKREGGPTSARLGSVSFEPDRRYAKNIVLGGRRIRVQYEDDRVHLTLDPMLAHLTSPQPSDHADLVMDIGVENGCYAIRIDADDVDQCRDATRLAPLVKYWLVRSVVEKGPIGIGLHAAAVVRGDACVLMPAAAGSGKSTLSAALMRNGYAYLADDFVLFDPMERNIVGMASCIAVKKGAWTLLAEIFPEVAGLPIHRRADDQVVRYLPPLPADPVLRNAGHRVTHIVFPQRAADTRLRVENVRQAAALARLISGAYFTAGFLRRSEVEAFADLVANADCYEIRYGDFGEAVAEVNRLTGA
jgi:hypothetical protein